MKGIELFLVLRENKKTCCKLIEKEIEYNDRCMYDITITTKGNQSGYSWCGKLEEKEQIKNKLLNHYRKQLKKDRKELEKSEMLLSKIL